MLKDIFCLAATKPLNLAVSKMVIILDGSSEYAAQEWSEIYILVVGICLHRQRRQFRLVQTSLPSHVV